MHMNRVIAGRDPVLVDACAAMLIAYDPGDINYIGLAEKLGVGSANLEGAEIVEINKSAGMERFAASDKASRMARWIEERDTCSACYGSLVHALARLEERGRLKNLHRKVHVGQGYKGMVIECVGVGMCTGECRHNLPGCRQGHRPVPGEIDLKPCLTFRCGCRPGYVPKVA